MQFLLYPLVIVAGLMSPLQAGCTSSLNKVLHQPFLVGLVNVGGTAIVTSIVALLLGQLGFQGKAAQVPWWAWFGGVAGAAFMLAQPIAAQKIGAGPSSGSPSPPR